MDTIQKFIDWCKANPNQRISDTTPELWEQLDNWRQAITDNTSIDCTFMPPWRILKLLKTAQDHFGPEILEDIQSTYNDL